MADIRINWEPPIDKSIVDSISIYRYAGETSDCNIILSDGVLVVENLAADSDNYDDLGIADSNHYSYGVFSKNVTGFSPCAHASLSLVPTIDGSPTDLTAVYVAAAPVEGPTNIVPTIEVAPKYGIDTGIFVYPLFITEAESDYYDSQFGGTGTSHTMTYNSVTYYMPDNGSTHAGTEAPTFVTINGNDFNYAQVVTGLELGNKPGNNEGPTSLALKVDMDEDGFYADVDVDDNDDSVNIAPAANSAPTGLTSIEQAVAPTNGPTALGTTASPVNGPTDLTSTEQIVAPANGPTDLTSTEQIVAPANGPTDLTSVEEILAPTSGPTDLTTLANPNEAPSALGVTANPNDAPTSLTSVEEILAPTSGPTNLTTLVDADEDGYYADVDLDDNDENMGLYPTNVDITFDGYDSTYAQMFSSNEPELYYIEGYSYIRRNGDSPMVSQPGTSTNTIFIRQGQTVTFTNNTTNMFYVRKQTDLSVNLLSIMGVNAPSNTGTYTFNELGQYGWKENDSGSVYLKFRVVSATAPLDSFQILDQGAAAGQSFAGDYTWDYYENNPSSLGWLQDIEQNGNTTFTIPSGYSTTYATILYRKTGTVWSHTGYGDALIRFESLSNGQDTKNYLYATFGASVSTQQILIYEITDQRPYTLGEVLPSWFISELAAEDYHISYTKRPIDSPANITAVEEVVAPTTGPTDITAEEQWSYNATQGDTLTNTLATDVDLEMLYVEPGTFTMGSPYTGLTTTQDQTEHQVQLKKGFYLSKYEVTGAQYEAVMTGNTDGLSAMPGQWAFAPNRPVEQVSWDDIQIFLSRLNAQQSENIPAGWQYVLPTEAQWEYACRAGTTTPWSVGNGTNLLAADGNFGNQRTFTLHVGMFEPNPWGFYDVHGNVREWTADWYDATYPVGDPVIDPTGPASGSLRVARGGGYTDGGGTSTSSYRYSIAPDVRNNDLGFRVALAPSTTYSAKLDALVFPGAQITNGFYAEYSGSDGYLEVTSTTATWTGEFALNLVIWSQSDGDNLATTTNFLAGWNIAVGTYSNGAYQDLTVSSNSPLATAT